MKFFYLFTFVSLDINAPFYAMIVAYAVDKTAALGQILTQNKRLASCYFENEPAICTSSLLVKVWKANIRELLLTKETTFELTLR